jgi:hypothetical protein
MAYQWAQLAEIAHRLDEVAEVKRGALKPPPAQPLWRSGDPSTLI